MPDQPQQPKGFGGTLKSKVGPLPLWGWLAIMTVLAVGYYLYAKNKQGSQQQQPVTGQPGVVVINQGDMDQGAKPPKPPEDHDKDDTSGKGHDDDDHHRHRKRHHKDRDTAAAAVAATSGASGSGGSPGLGIPRFPTSHQPGPPNVGQFFPKIGPAGEMGEGGSTAGEGYGGQL